MPSTTLQLSDCHVHEFLGIAANFGDGEYGYAVTPNVDHVIRYCDDAAFREIYDEASFVLLDSRFLARLLRVTLGLRLPICPGSDVTAELFRMVISPDDEIVLIGGNANQAEELKRRHQLKRLHHLDPPMGFINDPAAVDACLRFIEQRAPFRFCLLAVGCPQQEMLASMLMRRGRARGLALCIGGSINFLTGSERRAPMWMRRYGLEWSHRLIQDPGRMARRYLLRGPRIFWLLGKIKFELRAVDVAPASTG
jgi:exopolysaccharide biosynthesis WecB/TagA/CpsF family protein